MTFRTPHIVTIFRSIADGLSLTTSERRVLQFLLAGFVIGFGVKLTRELVASPTKFDYSATDSTFIALSAAAEKGAADATGEAAPTSDRHDAPPAGPVRINSASKAELMSLPGVGEVMAERIILDRQDHGSFTTIEDLERVRGIGARRIEQLRPLVIID